MPSQDAFASECATQLVDEPMRSIVTGMAGINLQYAQQSVLLHLVRASVHDDLDPCHSELRLQGFMAPPVSKSAKTIKASKGLVSIDLSEGFARVSQRVCWPHPRSPAPFSSQRSHSQLHRCVRNIDALAAGQRSAGLPIRSPLAPPLRPSASAMRRGHRFPSKNLSASDVAPSRTARRPSRFPRARAQTMAASQF